MPVYPGDPEVLIRQIHTLTTEGWNLSSLTLTTHSGTHVNAPIHMTTAGKSLDAFPPERFTGPTVLYTSGMTLRHDTGVIFTTQNIDMALAEKLVASPPKFIGLSEEFEFDTAVEKYLLEHDVVCFENLTNTTKLPEQFVFYGFPLKIKGGDGSPVRAVAAFE